MAIGGPSDKNPLNLFKYNSASGVAPKNQPEQVSSTEETPTDTASKSAANSYERIAQLQNTLGADGFVGRKVGPADLAKTAGANPLGSIKFNGNPPSITETSAPREPSSVEAIGGPEVVAATTNDNARLKLETTKLANLANKYNARTVDGDFFDVSAENTSLADNNTALAAARG
jgi:hypothetical protein